MPDNFLCNLHLTNILNWVCPATFPHWQPSISAFYIAIIGALERVRNNPCDISDRNETQFSEGLLSKNKRKIRGEDKYKQ